MSRKSFSAEMRRWCDTVLYVVVFSTLCSGRKEVKNTLVLNCLMSNYGSVIEIMGIKGIINIILVDCLQVRDVCLI